MIQLSQLQLKNFWIDDFSVQSILPEDGSEPPDSLSMHLGTLLNGEDNPENPREFRISMEIVMRPEREIPGAKTHNVKLKIIGLFNILPQASEESIKNYKSLSAPSILYGVARGFITMMTAMSRPGKFVIPSLDPRSFLTAEHVNHPQDEAEDKKNKVKRSRKKPS